MHVYPWDLPHNCGCLQAIQSGTVAFVQQLRKRKCGDSSEAVLQLSGHQFTTEYLQENGFNQPVLVECKDGLGIVVPHSSFTVADVEKHVGKCIHECNCVTMVSTSVCIFLPTCNYMCCSYVHSIICSQTGACGMHSYIGMWHTHLTSGSVAVSPIGISLCTNIW